MKAIISHDIDHIKISEHLFRDIIVPKYMIRTHIELVLGKINLHEYTLRWADFFKNKWQNVNELIKYNNQHNIPSSFFIAVNKGLGLNYTNASALVLINQMKSQNCEIGIHGIEFHNENLVKCEYDLFAKLTQKENFGIRMHYLRNSDKTFQTFAYCGYTYDSTECSFRNPYKIGNMWEFPFQIMDGYVIENGKKWQSCNFEQAKENTLRLIDKAHQENLNYLGIDFHDRYFSRSFKTWVDWYVWLVEYLERNKIEFVNFNQAISEVEKKEIKINARA